VAEGRAATLRVRDGRVVSCRMKSTLVACISLFLLLAAVIGCNEDGRHGIPAELFDQPHFHKTLTTLFDGVPPRGGEGGEEGPIDPNSGNARKRPEVFWSIHEPQRDCVRCHGNRRQRTFSREVQLTAQVPELCYECHDSFAPTSLEGWVHGPVAAGECLLCHEPHKTRNPHLLRRPAPELCYRCHEDMAAEEPILESSEEGHLMCYGCHQSHVGAMDHLKDRTPELCYKCHEFLQPAESTGYVHGPAAAGACLYCHEPHATEKEHWLKESIPELCYGCHDKVAIDSIRNHSEESYSTCNKCHQGHAGSDKYFLKQDWERNTVNERGEPGGIAEVSAE
jgi:predicted CXXCH cytochrome family protein